MLRHKEGTDHQRLELSPGVHYTHLQLENDKLLESTHILEVDVENPYMNMHVLSQDGKVGKLGRVRDIVYPIETDEYPNLVTAVNGDFFSHLGVPSGLQISDGEIITSPRMTKVAMILNRNRSVALENKIYMHAAVTAGDKQLRIDAINRTRKLKDDNHLFLYNRKFRDSTKTPEGGVEVVVSLIQPDADTFKTNQTMKGHVQSVTVTADTRMQPGTLVLSATGDKANWLQEQLREGDNIAID